jgi:outer membrane protein
MDKTKPARRLRGAARAAIAALAATGGPVGAMPLSEAFRIAYETNPTLIAARANLRVIDEGVAQARAGLRPRVEGSVSYGASYTEFSDPDTQALNSDRTSVPLNAELFATQPVYDGGETHNLVRARVADVSAARARLRDMEQETLLDVVTAYVDLIRDQEVLELARNNVRLLQEQLRAARDRFEVGEVTRTDVSQSQARLAEAQANLASAEGGVARARQAFRAAVGVDPGPLSEPPEPPPLPDSRAAVVEAALVNHPLLIASRFEETSAAREVRAAIGGLLPELSVDASLDTSERGLRGGLADRTTRTSVLARLTVPLYQGGAQHSRVRSAQASASQARAAITAEARERQRFAEAAWTELQVAEANIRAVRQQVEAARLAFEGVREEAIVGSRTTLDVLDAEQELLDARVDLVASERDEYVAAYALLAAIGALSLADLELPAEPYDPTVNYEINNDRWLGYEDTADTEWETLWRP